MERNHFLKSIILSGFAVSYLPLSSFHIIQEKFSKNQLIGKGNPDIIGNSYTSKMHFEAKEAFQKMKSEALKEGINIEVVSAYRSFKRQKRTRSNKRQRIQ